MNTRLWEQRSLGWIGGQKRREDGKKEGRWGIMKLEMKVKLRVSFTAEPFQFPREIRITT